jgi:hypothetical protein
MRGQGGFGGDYVPKNVLNTGMVQEAGQDEVPAPGGVAGRVTLSFGGGLWALSGGFRTSCRAAGKKNDASFNFFFVLCLFN